MTESTPSTGDEDVFPPRVWITHSHIPFSKGAQYVYAYRERKYPEDIEYLSLAEAQALADATADELAFTKFSLGLANAETQKAKERIAELERVLGIAEAAIESLSLTQKPEGMGLLGSDLVAPETLRQIREALQSSGEEKNE